MQSVSYGVGVFFFWESMVELVGNKLLRSVRPCGGVARGGPKVSFWGFSVWLTLLWDDISDKDQFNFPPVFLDAEHEYEHYFAIGWLMSESPANESPTQKVNQGKIVRIKSIWVSDCRSRRADSESMRFLGIPLIHIRVIP